MPIMLIFAFVALALITPALIYGIQQNNQMMIGLVAARQMRDVTHAAKGYITTYAAQIEGTATATTPATITVPMLVNTGFLPTGFGSTNPYQQTWEVQVLQPSPGDLQALVLSQGGVAIQAAEVPRIGAEEGGSGGSVQGAVAQGSFGSWQVSLTGYTNPGAGHVASLIDYSNGQLQSDYLYRTAVPSEPQLNTMQTNLDMGANNISNAQNVSVNNDVTLGNPGAATGGSSASAPGQLGVDEPAGQGFPNGWGGGIHTWDAYANGTVGAGTNGSLNAYLNNGGVVYAGNQMELGTANGTANVGWGCGPNGSVAANANGSGQTLACEAGTWQVMGAATSYLVWDAQYGGPSGITWANVCYEAGSSLPGFGGNYSGNNVHIYPVAGPNAQGRYYWYINGYFDGYAPYVECFDL